VGDSFVEAQGIAVDKTWTARLTRMGFSTYNLGVQGYAPQQITGTLKEFGLKIPSQYVLWGYTPGFEKSALNYAGNKVQPKQDAVSWIEGIHYYMHEVRDRGDFYPVLHALVDYFVLGPASTWLTNLFEPRSVADTARELTKIDIASQPKFDR